MLRRLGANGALRRVAAAARMSAHPPEDTKIVRWRTESYLRTRNGPLLRREEVTVAERSAPRRGVLASRCHPGTRVTVRDEHQRLGDPSGPAVVPGHGSTRFKGAAGLSFLATVATGEYTRGPYMGAHILAIDQGTTGTTVLVLDMGGRLVGRHTVAVPQHFPGAGRVEHDGEEIWSGVLEAIAGALSVAAIDPLSVRAIGITNQRETTLLWHRATGRPIHRAIVWQDRRTAPECAALRARGVEALVYERTGLLLDPYFSGTKLAWLLDHIEGARDAANRGELAFGTIDSWLVYKLTGGAHVTDVSNASRTMLLGLERLAWDDELLAALDVPRSVLPEVVPSAGEVGRTQGVAGLPDGIPIAGIAGDQQAALFGQGCFQPGDVKCTYGTGAFVLMNCGPRPLPSRHRLLTTVGWKIPGEVAYAIEGSAFIAGAAVQWLRDGLGVIQQAAEIEALARQVPDAGEVVFVPALTGMGAPHWSPEARGLLCGIGRDTTRAHIARATLDGIALQIADLVEAMARDAGATIASMRVDGGASSNDLLMQIQADVAATRVVRPKVLETTAMGAGMLAALGAGLVASRDQLLASIAIDRTFSPEAPAQTIEALRHRWNRAVTRALLT